MLPHPDRSPVPHPGNRSANGENTCWMRDLRWCNAKNYIQSHLDNDNDILLLIPRGEIPSLHSTHLMFGSIVRLPNRAAPGNKLQVQCPCHGHGQVITCMFLWCGRKPEHREENVNIGKIHSLHTEKSHFRLNILLYNILGIYIMHNITTKSCVIRISPVSGEYEGMMQDHSQI